MSVLGIVGVVLATGLLAGPSARAAAPATSSSPPSPSATARTTAPRRADTHLTSAASATAPAAVPTATTPVAAAPSFPRLRGPRSATPAAAPATTPRAAARPSQLSCTVPSAPATVTATPGATSLSVTWTAAADNGTALTGYVVAASSGTGVAVAVDPTTLTATLTGLKGGTATKVAVSGVSSCGTGTAGLSANATPTGSSTTYANAVVGSAPSAYYRLGESSTAAFGADSSGHGALSTWCTYVTRGAAGALAPGDPDPGVTLSANSCASTSRATLPLYDSARTVEAWVKPLDGTLRWVAGYGRNETDMAFSLGVGGSSVVVDAYNDAVTFPVGRSLVDGGWHHVVATYATGQLVAYVDGVQVGGRSFGPLDTVNDNGLYVGAFANGGGPFYGGLDDVAVYPTALSAATVLAHFSASGAARPAAPDAASASDGADNEAVVAWSVAAAKPAVTRYLVTAISSPGGVRSLSTVVAGTKTAARITGLVGGQDYTFAVAAGNAYGFGPETVTDAMTVSGTTTPYGGSVAADSPSAYYRLGEVRGFTVGADSSGRGALSSYSQVTLGTTGAVVADSDTAATTTGSCCVATANPALPVYNAARSVEFWAKPLSANGYWVTGWGRNETDTAFDVGIADSSVIVSAYSDDLSFPAGHTLLDGAWHQVAVTYDGTAVTAYLDGASLGTQAFAGALDTINDSALVVGAAHNGGSAFYGALDDVSIFPTALSAARVQAHFAASGHGVPAAVTGLAASVGTNAVTATWTAPASGADPLTSYLVTAKAGSAVLNEIAVPATATSATVTGLAAGTSVKVTVVPYDAYGPGAAATSAVVVPTGAASTYSAKVHADGALGYYRLGEPTLTPIAADSSGVGLPLTVASGTWGAPGALVGDADTAVTSPASGQVAFGAETLPAYNTARTVEVWAKPSDTYGRWLLGWGGGSGTDTGFDVGLQGSLVLVSAQSDDVSFQAPGSLADGLWHHVVVTYDGTLVAAYVDGRALGTRSFTGPLDTTDRQTLRIGAYGNGGGAAYGGLDEVAVYPTALSAAQVTAHFAASGHAVPAAVTGLTAAPAANAVTVSWTPTAGADPTTSYVVTAFVGGTAAANAEAVSGTATSATLTGLVGGTSYTVKVVASNGYGSGPAATSAAVTPSGSATTYAGVVLANNPRAYYRLGDGAGAVVAADSSGLGHPGSYSQVTLGAASGLQNDPDTAVNGTGGCCIATAVSSLPSGNAARTVEAWVRPNDTSGRWFASWGVSATRRAFDVGVQDSSVLVSAYSDDLTFPVGRSLVDGAWHHVVATYDGTTAKAYVDGRLVGAKAFAGALHTAASSPLQIGSFVNGGGGWYGGLDELSVQPGALSAANVAAHFAASGHGVPTAAGSVSATARSNGAQVSWSAASAGDGVAGYVVTALVGGAPRNALVVAGTATSALLTGLAGGTAVTVRVVAYNSYGQGPAATSGSVTPTGPATTYASSVLASSPLAYYRLGEAGGVTQGADSSGVAGLLILSRGTYGASGAVVGDTDTAVTADGGCCIATGTASLPAFNSSRSVEAWVKPSDTSTRYELGWGSSATNRAFDLGTQGDNVVVASYGDDLSFPAGRSLVDGAWHHVVATYDGSVATAYVDGVSLGSRSFHGTLNTVTTGLLRVGAASDGGGPAYGGVDEVAVYGAVLTPAAVLAHFTASGHSAPKAPKTVKATAGANRVTVTWAAGAAVADGTAEYVVTVLQGTTPVGSVAVPSSTLNAVVTGLKGGAAVTAVVRAGNAYGLVSSTASTAVTPSGSATTYASSVLADGPVTYHRLGEATSTPVGADSSATAALLSYCTSNVTLGVTGALPSDTGNSGVSDNGGCVGSVRVGAVLPRYNGARSVEFWAKPNDTATRYAVGWGTSNYNRTFDVATQGTSVFVTGYGDDLTFTGTTNLADGAWHHVVVTSDGTTATAYVDGTSLGTQTFPAVLNTVTDGLLWVGSYSGGSSGTYGGLDEVAVYPTVLSPARVAAHYAAR